MHRTLFTLGYEKRTLEEFIGILADNRITVLIDVRETAWSHKPGFSKRSLRTALERSGITYLHADFAGNPKWLRREAGSHAESLAWYRWYLGEFDEIVSDFNAVVDGYLADGARVCLTCYERHAEDCHRAIIAEIGRKHGGYDVQHLAVEGCKRLVTV